MAIHAVFAWRSADERCLDFHHTFNSTGYVRHYVLEGSTWQLGHEWQAHARAVLDIKWHTSGKYIYTAALDGSVKAWDPSHLGACSHDDALSPSPLLLDAPVASFQHPTDKEACGCIGLGPVPEDVYVGFRNGAVRKWSLGKGLVADLKRGHTDIVYTINFSPDGKHFASASYDNTVKIWDAETLLLARTHKRHSVVGAYYINNDKLLVATYNSNIAVMDVVSGTLDEPIAYHTVGSAITIWTGAGTYYVHLRH